MKIADVDGAGLDAALAETDRAVLVDFWGPWCVPCRTLRPHLERLAVDYADRCRIVAVNVEDNTDVGERFEVSSVPTLILLRNGETIHRFNGAAPPSMIASQLDEL